MAAAEAEFVNDSQALAVRSSEALMPALSMQQAVERYTQIKQFVQAVMDTGRDYGTIPGAGKDKVLLKPGAEKLCTLFNLKPRLVIMDETEDWMGAQHGGEPFFSYHYKIQLYRNEEFMGEADAALNSWEEKYRWRSGNRKCPLCGSEAIIVGKKEYGGGFICFAKKGGCGAKFSDDDKAITSQQTGRVPNDRIFDQINTMRKMCYKRALIAATLVAVNASDFFTQDLEVEEDSYRPPAEPVREEEPETDPPMLKKQSAHIKDLMERLIEGGVYPDYEPFKAHASKITGKPTIKGFTAGQASAYITVLELAVKSHADNPGRRDRVRRETDARIFGEPAEMTTEQINIAGETAECYGDEAEYERHHEQVTDEPTTEDQQRINVSELVDALTQSGFKGNVFKIIYEECGERKLANIPVDMLPVVIARLGMELGNLRKK